MKDMSPKDILLRQDRPLTSLSVYRNGVWRFEAVDYAAIKKREKNQTFYLMSEAFGLVRQGTVDPKVRVVSGAPGDYISINIMGVYSLVTKAEYAMKFPPPNLTPPTPPNNSSQIKDKNFLTNILKGSGSTTSNSKTTKPTSPNTGY